MSVEVDDLDLEHAVLINFNFDVEKLAEVHDIEEALGAAVESAGVGMCDGHDLAVGGGPSVIYLYGANADALFAEIEHILVASPILVGALIEKRFGPPEDSTRSEYVEIKRSQ